MSYSEFSPRAGDIVGAYLPHYLSPGLPGNEFRLALVLAVEVDPEQNKVEGLYLCRLSERTEKVRDWDYAMQADEIENAKGLGDEGFVLRTPRIDLIPTTPEFLGEAPEIYGNLRKESWMTVLPKIHHGQNSSFAAKEGELSPRPKLAHTVIATAADAPEKFVRFDYEAMAYLAGEKRKVEPAQPMTPFEREFKSASAQANIQSRFVAGLIHEDFIEARRAGRAFACPDTKPYLDRACAPK
jgi:hypothetical protein